MTIGNLQAWGAEQEASDNVVKRLEFFMSQLKKGLPKEKEFGTRYWAGNQKAFMFLLYDPTKTNGKQDSEYLYLALEVTREVTGYGDFSGEVLSWKPIEAVLYEHISWLAIVKREGTTGKGIHLMPTKTKQIDLTLKLIFNRIYKDHEKKLH